MKTNRFNYGANWALRITGTSEEVNCLVIRLFNFGIISNVPEEAIKLKSGQICVTVLSDRKRMLRGALAMATADYKSSLRNLWREAYGKATARKLRCIQITLGAARFVRQFVPETPMRTV